MPQEKPKPELTKIVHVTADVMTLWDGKEYDLSKGADVKLGIVNLWKVVNPDIEFTISEVEDSPKASREVPNPLSGDDRGKAFPGIRRKNKGE